MRMEVMAGSKGRSNLRRTMAVVLDIPREEFIQAQAVNPFRDWGGDAG